LVPRRVAPGGAVESHPADGAEVRIPGRARRARSEDDECHQAQAGRTKTLRAIRSLHDTPLPQDSRPRVGSVDLAGGESNLRAGPVEPVSPRHVLAAPSSDAPRSGLRNI